MHSACGMKQLDSGQGKMGKGKNLLEHSMVCNCTEQVWATSVLVS